MFGRKTKKLKRSDLFWHELYYFESAPGGATSFGTSYIVSRARLVHGDCTYCLYFSTQYHYTINGRMLLAISIYDTQTVQTKDTQKQKHK